jgi:hypothetical protein
MDRHLRGEPPSGEFFLGQLVETFFWRVKLTVTAMKSTRALTNWRDPLRATTVRAATVCCATCRLQIAVAGIVLFLPLAAGVACAQRTATDYSAQAQKAALEHFASLRDYQPGDLVTRSQVAAALAKVKASGVDVPAAERILAASVPDNSFLARELSTPAGRKFMRNVARHPGAYSRLDRLSTISRGETLVRELIRSADGDKFIEYLTTTRGGRKLGSTLAGAREGTDLNQPTGRIYTAEDLLAALDQMPLRGTGRAR